MNSYPDKQSLTDLISGDDQSCVSILMRTHSSGRDTTQNPIRFKNLIGTAIQQAPKSDDALVEKLESLASLEHDTDFWQHQSEGIAIFVSSNTERRFSLSHAPDESVNLADQFNIRPLAGAACGQNDIRALAITWERARLFRSDGHASHEVQDEMFPVAMEELVTERDPEEQLQFTSHGTAASGGTGTAMYHGHGEGENKIEADRQTYLSRVADRVSDRLYNQNWPLLLVATEEVGGHFSSEADSFTIAETIHTSPDGIGDDELATQITDWAASHQQKSNALVSERLGTALANQAGSTELSEIIRAAADGKVDTLLLSKSEPVHGHYDFKSREIDYSEDASTDLLNIAVCLTLKAAGDVREMPQESFEHEQAAIFRY